MAITTAEQTQLAALIAREGGIVAFTKEVTDIYVASAQAGALTTLSPAITVTVQSWPVLAAYVAQPANATMYTVMGAINAAAGAQDASKLGPLLVALYASVKVHLGV